VAASQQVVKHPRANGRVADQDLSLPHSVETEQMVLGSLLLDPSVWPREVDSLGETDFFRRDHRLIFRAMRTLADLGEQREVIAVFEQLRAVADAEHSGGVGYLGTLARETSTAANLAYYARQLKQLGDHRRLIERLEAHLAKARSVRGQPVDELAAEAIQDLEGLRSESAPNQAAPDPETSAALAGIRSAASITTGVLQPVRYFTDERIPRGLVLLVARPKMRKSWFALQAMKAGAEGSELLGRPTRLGPTLGIFLEDNDRRMQQRLAFLGSPSMLPDARERLHIVYAWPKGDAGVKALRAWLQRQPDTTLIVIDVLQKFREDQDPRTNAYAGDYAALETLHALARQYPDLTLLVVHHTRKGRGDSPGETVSGTHGITGAADAYVILEPGPEANTAKVHIDGRDWESWTHDFVWRFDEGCGWVHVRNITELDSLSASQRDWLELVRQHGRITPTAAADERSVSQSAASQMLAKLAKLGFLGVERGTYFVLG
jgi:hypothetical protein